MKDNLIKIQFFCTGFLCGMAFMILLLAANKLGWL